MPKDFYRSDRLVLVFLALSLAENRDTEKLPVSGAPPSWVPTTTD